MFKIKPELNKDENADHLKLYSDFRSSEYVVCSVNRINELTIDINCVGFVSISNNEAYAWPINKKMQIY